MAEPIGALRALLSASSAVFEKDMKQARDAVRKNTVDMSAAMEKFAGKANQSIKAIFTMRTALTLLAGTTGLFYATKRAVEFADSIDKTSKSVGLGAEVFQEYRIAAALSGVGQEKFTAALTKFTQTVGAAARGSKSGKGRFKFRYLGPCILQRKNPIPMREPGYAKKGIIHGPLILDLDQLLKDRTGHPQRE